MLMLRMVIEGEKSNGHFQTFALTSRSTGSVTFGRLKPTEPAEQKLKTWNKHVLYLFRLRKNEWKSQNSIWTHVQQVQSLCVAWIHWTGWIWVEFRDSICFTKYSIMKKRMAVSEFKFDILFNRFSPSKGPESTEPGERGLNSRNLYVFYRILP
jgi:hypothetical protein